MSEAIAGGFALILIIGVPVIMTAWFLFHISTPRKAEVKPKVKPKGQTFDIKEFLDASMEPQLEEEEEEQDAQDLMDILFLDDEVAEHA